MAAGPIGYTCPEIDRAVGECEDVQDLGKKIADRLEELRKANEKLRAWGAEQEEYAYKLEEELAEMAKRAEDLEGDLLEARAEISNMETSHDN